MKTEVFHGENNIDIEYVLKKSKAPSENLVVSFPAPAGRVHGGEWGYLFALQQLKNINILFPRSTAENGLSRMTYHNGEPVIENAVVALINYCANETQSTRIICVGSSMGAYSALYFGLKYNWDIISQSSPYTFKNLSKRKERILYAAGNLDPESESWLDGLLSSVVKIAGERGYNKRFYISWGKGEFLWRSSYEGKQMIKDLDAAGIKYDFSLLPFSDHQTVGLIFPNVLKIQLSKFLGIGDESSLTINEDPRFKYEKELSDLFAKISETIKNISYLDYKDIDIVNPVHYGTKDKNICNKKFKCIQNNLYVGSDNDFDNPIIIGEDGNFWNIELRRKDHAQRSFYFQDAILNYYMISKDNAAYEWLINNIKEYFNIKVKKVIRNPVEDIPRFHFLLAFIEEIKKRDFTDEEICKNIIVEIVKTLKDSISRINRKDMAIWKYRLVLAILHFNACLKLNADDYNKLYSYTLELMSKYMEYHFDSNGMYICGGINGLDAVAEQIVVIINFIKRNNFPESKQYKDIVKKLNNIINVSCHISSPNGFLIPLNDAAFGKKSKIQKRLKNRTACNLILKDSNIAFLEDENSISYITINSGSNLHAKRKHCDLLSFTWCYMGKEICCDNGGGNEPCDEFAVSAIAHSAFICDELNYMIPDYNDWTTINSYKEDEKYVSIDMSHMLIDDVEMRRRFIWIKPNIIALIDVGYSGTKHKYTQNFIFGDKNISYNDASCVDINIDENLKTTIRQFIRKNDIEFKEYRGENNRGMRIANGSSYVAGLNIAYSQNDCSSQFVTVLECHSTNSDDKINNEHNVKSIALGESSILFYIENDIIEVKINDFYHSNLKSLI